jgi:hypothetical protein
MIPPLSNFEEESRANSSFEFDAVDVHGIKGT